MTGEPTQKTDPNAIGVAISGGGHRATAYALGVLLYLVDSGLNRRVRTITSVSGGSILNAFVALLRSPDSDSKRSFRSFAGFGSFDPYAARLASLLSGNRTVWFVCVAAGLLGDLTVIVLFFLSVVDGSTALLSLAVLLLALSILIGPRSGGSLWGWWGTWLYCSSIAWLAAAAVIAGRTTRFWSAELAIGVVLCGWLLQQRHRIAELAFEHTICRPLARTRRWPMKRARLEDMDTEVRHVFCATEMHSGKHAFFSHDVVYARGFGLGRPAGLPVATAVQVSANFPGGFPIRPLRASRFEFSVTDRFEHVIERGIPVSGRDILMRDEDIAWATANQQFPDHRPLPDWLMLSDGGVFDNLAVDWFLDNETRRSRFLMCLNWDWDGKTQSPLESGTNARDKAILESLQDASDCLIVVNAGVTAHWQRTSRAQISLPFIGEVIGLSHISGTMYNNYTKERIRALQEHVVIEMGFSERLVRTTLLPLGEQVTASLLRAGYYDAMFAARTRFDHPHLNVEDKDFASLVRGRHGGRTSQGDELDQRPTQRHLQAKYTTIA